ncbi:MAG: KpsF/GutQ family sugar-phosphate isomerase [Candidatus Omnitrophota bacterium]
MKKLNKKTILDWAEDVLTTETKGLENVKAKLGKNFFESIKIASKCKGRLIISGMGKAGIIGQKFSATLSSTGTSSFWLHAAEAVHGDLGRIKKNDIVIILSYSGQTDEIKNLIPFVKKIGSKIIAITGNVGSNLAQYSDVVIDVAVDKEACGLGLAPTTSTTAMLAICDAISVVLQKIKGFKEKDFASFHPRGSLGRKLLLKVSDIMRKKKSNPVVDAETSVDQVLLKITSAHAGAATVVDKKNKIIGIFTDGDLRRNLKKDRNILNKKVKLVMSAKPTVVKDSDLASQALKVLEKKKIDELPVVDKNNHPVGMLDIQDLIAAGLV